MSDVAGLIVDIRRLAFSLAAGAQELEGLGVHPSWPAPDVVKYLRALRLELEDVDTMLAGTLDDLGSEMVP